MWVRVGAKRGVRACVCVGTCSFDVLCYSLGGVRTDLKLWMQIDQAGFTDWMSLLSSTLIKDISLKHRSPQRKYIQPFISMEQLKKQKWFRCKCFNIANSFRQHIYIRNKFTQFSVYFKKGIRNGVVGYLWQVERKQTEILLIAQLWTIHSRSHVPLLVRYI